MPNNHDFDHYAESAEQMNKIDKFFNKFFLINMIKIFLGFLFMPTQLYSYSHSAITAFLIISALQIFLSIYTPYENNYKNKTQNCRITDILMIITEIIFMLINSSTSLMPWLTVTFGGIAVITQITALTKFSKLEELKQLKGYPLFSELLDNPKYVPPVNMPQKTLPPPLKPIISVKLPNTNIKPNVSVKIPNLQPEPITSPMMSEPVKKFSEDIMIPPSCDTPAESRILGNATVDYTEYVKLNDLYDNHKQSGKKINLSKIKSLNSDEI